MVRVAIVGSRRHPNRQQVVDYVNSLPPGTIIVSGGAKGVDTWAVDAATARGLPYLVFPAKWQEPCKEHGEGCRVNRGNWFYYRCKGYERNQDIVDAVDEVVAFVMPDRKGGTEDTVKKAIRARKPVKILLPE